MHFTPLCRLIATELARIHSIHAHNGCIPKPNLWVKMHKYMALVSTEFTPEAKNTRYVVSHKVYRRQLVLPKMHLLHTTGDILLGDTVTCIIA